MSQLGKSCLMCEHFRISLGERNWSELTPGGPGRIECSKGKQVSLDEDDCSAKVFRLWVRFGNDCPEWVGAE